MISDPVLLQPHMIGDSIDPAKVVRCALENAASVATLLLTSDALIAEKSKEQSKGHARDADMY